MNTEIGIMLLSSASSATQRYTQQRRETWAVNAGRERRLERWVHVYHRRLEQVYQAVVPPGQRVLELGCGTGDLLAAVAPSFGVGLASFSKPGKAREMLCG
jgi:tRNA G46 methylase TrmB